MGEGELIKVVSWVLVSLVKGVADAALEKAGRRFVALVGKIRRALGESPPEDERALAEAVARVLRENPELLVESAAALRELASRVEASGERSVAIGGDVEGSTIITGDQNVVSAQNKGDDG